MKGVYTQQNSPYYWLRYYDKLEPDPARKRKSVNTKIPITPSDRERAKKKEKLVGTAELRKLVKEFRTGIAERDLQAKSGVKLKKSPKLSEGFAEFVRERSVPNVKNQLRPKTIQSYAEAVKHFINANSDKQIHKYTKKKDYLNLLHYFEDYKVPGKKIKKKGKEVRQYKSLSINSRSIYTRALKTLWNYFLDQRYASVNIIEPIDQELKDPEPIPVDEMYLIIQYFKQDNDYPHHYWIIYFMLLTGCRPSSAIVQKKEDIDFKKKQITIRNVKSGRGKKKEFYRFPLYTELQKLLKEMNVKQGDEGRLFDMYSVVPNHYTWPLSFWNRSMKFLYKAKKISKEYNLKQIRPTLASFLINILKVEIFTVQKLLDHADIKVTDRHYVDFNLTKIRKELDDFTLEDFLE